VQERFGIDQASWRALTESLYPAAQTTEAIILVLSYCRARNLDPFKKPVHIVPIWDKKRRCMVETVWPGIAEFRTTAFRTGEYAGREATEFGPDVEQTWTDEETGPFAVRFPEWAQVTVYRTVKNERRGFPGPRVYWLETFASVKSGAPNTMWKKRPHGQLDKCAEAAALRAAFPEELGGEEAAEEVSGFTWHGRSAIAQEPTGTRTEQLIAKLTPPAPVAQASATEGDDSTDGEQGDAATEQPPVEQPAEPEPAEEESPAEAPTDADYDQAQVVVVEEYRTLINMARTPDRLKELGAQAGIDPRLRASAKVEIQEILKTKSISPTALPPRRGRPPKDAPMFPA
jgi:phage recombination protein Bet